MSKPFLPDVADIFRRSAFTADSIDIPEVNRDLYMKMKAAIEGLGGKWNRKRKTHVFHQPPRTLLSEDFSEPINGNVSFEAINKTVQAGGKIAAVPNLFPTPPAVADIMVELAKISKDDVVLEPSAGTGNLIDAVKRAGINPIVFTAIEQNQALREGLVARRARGEWWDDMTILRADFLTVTSSELKFTKILMNPPFDKGIDIKHVEHALGFLEPGGKLVAIIAGGSRQAAAFKDRASYWEELPSGTFAGTGVRSILMVIDKE